MHPTVLVTSSYVPYPTNPTRWYSLAVPAAYVDSVRLAGGVPLVTGPLDNASAGREVLKRVDAVLLIGGPDYDPATYDRRRHPKTELLHSRRDRSDLLLSRAAVKAGKPLLGICGGMQAINIALGGTLHQHVPELPKLSGRDNHTMRVPDDNVHRVRLAAGSLLKRSMRCGAELEVNSSHHQAIDRLGKGLVAVAWTSTGLVEAFEGARRGRFLLGVQWHPERLAVRPSARDIGAAPKRGRPEQLAIFRALVEAAE